MPADLLGSWVGTVLLIDGVDLAAANATTLQVTFNADNTFSFTATNDLFEDFCDVGPGCTESDTYSATQTQIVFSYDDPDPAERTTLSLELTPTASRIFGIDDGGVSIDWSFVR